MRAAVHRRDAEKNAEFCATGRGGMGWETRYRRKGRMLGRAMLGKLWSQYSWCLVPDAESDLGCGDGMLGGEEVLKRTKLDPAGEIVK